MKLYRHFFIPLAILFFLIINKLAAQDIISSIEKKLVKYKETAAKERVLVLTDRDVYEPGEIIWLDITTFDIFAPQISMLSAEVSVSLLNQKQFEVLNKKIVLKEGSANSFLQLPAGLVGGVYLLRAMTENSGETSYYNNQVIVRENSLPRYVVEASFPDKEYIPGDKFAMLLQFKDFYNEPQKNVEYQLDLFDGGKKVTGVTGKTNKTGQVSVNVNVPSKLKSGFFSYRVSADSKGGLSSLSGKFPVLTDKLFIDFYPENGNLIDGMETKIFFHAYDLNGIPLAIEADLLENGNPIHTFSSSADGLGSFLITPDITKNYNVQMKRPLLLESMYNLLPIESKGVILKLISKNQSQAKYKLINAYQSERLIYLIGVAGGEIFWRSEHELDNELDVDIDLTKAQGRLAHMVVFNAAEHIEGEHIMVIPGSDQTFVTISNKMFSAEKRGENRLELNFDPAIDGKVVFTVVNSPWMLDKLNNRSISAITLPADLFRQMVFLGKEFNGSELNTEILEKYIPYYFPNDFGMDKIVKQKGTYSYINEQRSIANASSFVNPLLGQYREELSEGSVHQINMLANDFFATSKPGYLSGLSEKKKKKPPAYKDMLDKNVPVMEVLQAVKPYNLVGNNIVFMSSALSISSQGGALIVIDGIASGTDPSVIRNLNPLNVESISASTDVTDIQRYTGFNSVGVIEITTKSGEKTQSKEVAVDQDLTFTAPDYSSRKGGPDDYRKTLNWDVSHRQGGEPEKSFVFYNSDLISKVKGKLYFIPYKGSPDKITFDFEVK